MCICGMGTSLLELAFELDFEDELYPSLLARLSWYRSKFASDGGKWIPTYLHDTLRLGLVFSCCIFSTLPNYWALAMYICVNCNKHHLFLS